MERPSWNETYIDICNLFAKRSLCLKYQTGAVIIKGTQIIGTGYNGTVSKTTECNMYWKQYYDNNVKNVIIKKRKHKNDAILLSNTFDDWIKTAEFKDLHSAWSINHEIHAEMNALQNVSKNDIDDTCILYTCLSPCEQCAKHIVSYGIKNVYYHDTYKGKNKGTISGLEYLKNNNVICIQV
jgi:dCMP deaminase